MSEGCGIVTAMTKTTCSDRIVGFLDEMEYAMANAPLFAVTLTCDFCPQTWEFDAPADWEPHGDLMCADCQDEWEHFEFAGEDSYLDTYWESMYE